MARAMQIYTDTFPPSFSHSNTFAPRLDVIIRYRYGFVRFNTFRYKRMKILLAKAVRCYDKNTAFKFIKTRLEKLRKKLHILDQERQGKKQKKITEGKYFVNFRIMRIFIVIFFTHTHARARAYIHTYIYV